MKAVKTHVNILPFLPLPPLDIVQLFHAHDLARGDCDNKSAYTLPHASGRHRHDDADRSLGRPRPRPHIGGNDRNGERRGDQESEAAELAHEGVRSPS